MVMFGTFKFLRIFSVSPLEEKKSRSHLLPLKMEGFCLSVSFEGGKVYVAEIDLKSTDCDSQEWTVSQSSLQRESWATWGLW